MTAEFAPTVKPSSYNELLSRPSLGASEAARTVERKLFGLRRLNASQEGATATIRVPIEEQLFDSRAQFKMLTSQIAMHIDPMWRSKLFKQVDSLLDAEEWPEGDVAPTLSAYRTLLRLLLMLHPAKKPGFGASHDGHIIAAWTTEKNILTVECCANDQIRWSLVRSSKADEPPERAVGKNKIQRLPDILAAYDPEIWFDNDGRTAS